MKMYTHSLRLFMCFFLRFRLYSILIILKNKKTKITIRIYQIKMKKTAGAVAETFLFLIEKNIIKIKATNR